MEAATADTLNVTLAIDGAIAQTTTIQRAANPTSFELDFGAYQAGQALTITANALVGDQIVGTATDTVNAAKTCTSISLSLVGKSVDPPDAGTADLMAIDAASADLSATDLTAPSADMTTATDLTTIGNLTLLAGKPGGGGYADGIGIVAHLGSLISLTNDGAGNLYGADSSTNTIRKLVIATNEVTIFAGAAYQTGFADGTGPAARFNGFTGITSDGNGHVYVVSGGSIRAIDLATAAVTTLVATSDSFSAHGVASDHLGNLYVTDTGAGTIRKIVIATAVCTVVAGTAMMYGTTDGIGAAARFSSLGDISYDGAGSLYISDNHTVRMMVIATAAVTTIAGTSGAVGSADAPGADARFGRIASLVSDGAGNVFVADANNHTIRKVVVSSGVVTTINGTSGVAGYADGTGIATLFYTPSGLALDGAGALYVGEPGNSTIRKITLSSGVVTTAAGSPLYFGSADGTGSAARFQMPEGMATDGAGNLYVTDTANSTVRRIVIATGAVTTVAGTAGHTGASNANLNKPTAIASDGAGNLYIADSYNHQIRRLVIATGELTDFVGGSLAGSDDGTGTDARFYYPSGIAADGAGNLYVADTSNHTIRQIVIASGAVTTFAGTAHASGNVDGVGAAASFNGPQNVVSDGAGNLYVADYFNGSIRKVVIATAAVTTITTGLFEPNGLAADATTLYFADHRTVQKLAIATGAITTVVSVDAQMGVQLGPLPASLSHAMGLLLIGNDLAITDDEEAVLIAQHP